MEEFTELLYRAKGGDVGAYGHIVRRFQDMAVAYAHAQLGDFHLAEDVAQEAFVEAYLNLDKVYGPRAFPAWLRRIVFKYCDRVWRRRQVRAVSLDLAGEVESAERDPARALDEKESRAGVLAAVGRLPEPERTTVNLFYIGDLSQKEVAAFLDLPVSTVNFRLHSARKRLKKELTSMARTERENLQEQLAHKEEELLEMTKEDLQRRRPSNDGAFAAKVEEELRTFEKLHGGLAPVIKEIMLPALGREAEIEVRAAHRTRFGYFALSLGKHCCNYTYRMRPLEGWVHLNFSIPLAAGLLEPQASGEDFDAQVAARLATPVGEGKGGWVNSAEIQTLNDVVRPVIKALEAAWKPVQEVKIGDIELETVPTFINQTGGGEKVIHTVLEIKAAGRSDMTLDLCYPLATLAGPLPALGRVEEGA